MAMVYNVPDESRVDRQRFRSPRSHYRV